VDHPNESSPPERRLIPTTSGEQTNGPASPQARTEVTTMVAESPLVTTAADLALVLAAFLSLLCGYRVVRGPTTPDRVVGLDAIATNVVAIAVLFALKTDRGLFVTVSLVLAIIGFLSTVAVAKYVTEGDIIVRRE
jgi:multicomponent Na+:H+ antiporter subunit F